MATKALVIDAGTTKRVPDAETLIVGAGIDAATPTTLTIGGTTATSITLGSATIPVSIPGDVNTLGGTTFQSDATFEGNVTFGNGPADTVAFAASTTVVSNIAFGGGSPTYKITNLANGTNPNDAVNFSQLSSLVSGVTASAPLASSGGSTPNISLTGTVGVANGGTGVSTVPTNGQLLIGNGSGYSVAGLTAGSGVTITPGAGTITIAATGSGGTITGSGTATQLAYFTGASAIGSESAIGSDALTWDSTNNALGIRVASGSFTSGASLDVGSGQIAIPDGTALLPSIAFRDDMNTGFYSPTNDVIGFTVNGGEIARLRLEGVGSTPVFLLGTTSVIGAITVDSSDPSGTAGVGMIAHANAGTTIQESYRGGQFAGVRTRGTKGGPTPVGADDGLWNALGAGFTSASGYNYGALITFKAEEAYTALASGGRIEFHTTTNGSSGTATLGGATTERMRIANSGHVGIGTTNVSGHLFNIGSGANANFAVASGGRIHTYGGAAPTDGQVLIGNTANGRFEAASLTAGSGITITPGAGAITIAATAGTDYSVVTLTTAQPANTAVTVAGAAAIATAASTSRVAGIVTATNTVKVLGICTCIVEGVLSIAAGDVVYLSAATAGRVTNVAPSTATQVVAELGIATAASSGGTVAVLWQPKSIVVL
jgi:hypothetical protein